MVATGNLRYIGMIKLTGVEINESDPLISKVNGRPLLAGPLHCRVRHDDRLQVLSRAFDRLFLRAEYPANHIIRTTVVVASWR